MPSTIEIYYQSNIIPDQINDSERKLVRGGSWTMYNRTVIYDMICVKDINLIDDYEHVIGIRIYSMHGHSFDVTKFLAKFDKLLYLNASNCELGSLDMLTCKDTIEFIHVPNNRLIVVDLGHFSKLINFNGGYNPITNINYGLNSKLKHLMLACTQVSSIPDYVLANLSSMWYRKCYNLSLDTSRYSGDFRQ